MEHLADELRDLNDRLRRQRDSTRELSERVLLIRDMATLDGYALLKKYARCVVAQNGGYLVLNSGEFTDEELRVLEHLVKDD